MSHPVLGKQLKIWRKHSGLSQAALEEKAGLGHNTVSRIERGESSPTASTVNKIAKALRISYEQLIIGIPPNKKNPEKVCTYKDRMLSEIERLSELECRELYPVLEQLVNFSKKRDND